MGMGGIQDVNEMGCGEATPPAKEGKGQDCVEAVESGNSSPWEGGTVAMGRGWGGSERQAGGERGGAQRLGENTENWKE